MYQNQQPSQGGQNQYEQDLSMVKNENDLKNFLQKHNSNPMVQKMLQMTQGKNPTEYIGIAQNLAASSGINFGDFRKFIGF